MVQAVTEVCTGCSERQGKFSREAWVLVCDTSVLMEGNELFGVVTVNMEKKKLTLFIFYYKTSSL